MNPCLNACVTHTDIGQLCRLLKYPQPLCWQSYWHSLTSRFRDKPEEVGVKQILPSTGMLTSDSNRDIWLFVVCLQFSCVQVKWAKWWCRPQRWEDQEGLREWLQWGSSLDTRAATDDSWYTFHHRGVMRADSTVPVWGGRGCRVHPLFRPRQQLLCLAWAQQWPHTPEIF